MSRKLYAIAAICLVLATMSAPAQGADYVKQSTATYHLTDNVGQRYPYCTGRAWIGLTPSGYVEASTSLTCSGSHAKRNDVRIQSPYKSLNFLAYNSRSCAHGTTTCIVSTSIRATPGKQYCNYSVSIGNPGFTDSSARSGPGWACLIA